MEALACERMPGLAERSSPAALQGTWGHEAVAQTLALIYADQGRMDDGEALAHMAPMIGRLEPWTQDGVRRCVAYAVALVAQAERETERRASIVIERHLDGAGIDIPRGGTADLVILAGTRAVVADWKLGFLDQGPAAEHRQLHAYAVMCWDRYEVDRVDIHIAQGRIRKWSAAAFDAASIEQAREATRHIVATARKDDPPLHAHIDACRYCKALPWCREAREHIMLTASEAALFGLNYEDRARMDEDAKLAARFAQAVKEQQKAWQQEAREREASESRAG